MAIAASAVIDKAQKLMQDAGDRFPDSTTMLPWLNDGLLEAVNLKPSLGVTTVDEALEAGARQSITGAGVEKFINHTPVTLAFLNQAMPGWQEHAAAATVKFVAYDPNEPKVFYVYPPQPVDTTAVMAVSEVTAPAPLADVNANIPFDDIYAPALIDYLCYRCYLGEMDAASLARADVYFAAFIGKIGGFKKPAASKSSGEPQ